jgi:dipeptidyl aminopeptidase/acylaminoacyl peptidase
MRLYLLAVVSSLVMAAFSPATANTVVGPSVRDVVEFRTIVWPIAHDAEGMRQQTSPDGSRGFIVTRRANVKSDANRYEILMLDLSPARLTERRPAAPEVVFAFDAEHDNESGYPALAQVRWANERTLVFRAKVKDSIFQIYSLDLPSRKVVQLTNAATSIESFAASRDLKRVVYLAQAPNPPMRDGARSIVVGTQWFRAALYGQQDPRQQNRKYRFWVQDVGPANTPRPLGDPFLQANAGLPAADISPDGRWAILPRYERDRTAEWSRKYPIVRELADEFGPALRRDPLGYFTGPMAYTARRMVAWRLTDAREQAILDAPDDCLPGGLQSRRDRVWQSAGRSVILAGTHLPLIKGSKVSVASHVVEYWPDSGRLAIVARLNGRLESAVGVGDELEVGDGGKLRQFRRVDGVGWQEAAPMALPSKSAWTLRVKESANEPPDAFAEGPAGQSVRLTTLNPHFDTRTWGAMTTYTWRDAQGRQWHGGLMTPADAIPGKPLPLVIEAYNYFPENFYIAGSNGAKRAATSAFPGRALLREGVLVLAMPVHTKRVPFKDDADQNRLFNEGVRGAVNALVRAGRADPNRVGIIGWSMSGEKVLNLITFSDLPIRAATIADGDSNTLFSYTLTYGFTDYTWGHKETVNHGIPARQNLSAWVRTDPSLNTECIRSALRIETYGVPVHNHWDIYALLRRQYKAADMILIPGGSHGLSTPSERMISLQGNVDWFNFWLKGEKRRGELLATETEASLRAQYEAWDQMAGLKQADDRLPRCSLTSVG